MRKAVSILFALAAISACNSATPQNATDAPLPDPPDATPDATPPDATLPDAAPAYGCGSNDDCQANQICTFAPQHACGRGGGRGICEPQTRRFCVALTFWVCGCNDVTYSNMCKTDISDVDVAYGGPCRPAGLYVPCQTSADCPIDPDQTHFQYCVDDPRDSCDPAAGGTGCAGVCVNANQACGQQNLCLSQTSYDPAQSPQTEMCVTTIDPHDPDTDTGACVYTTRVKCVGPADCDEGELCLPDAICQGGPSCLGSCVRP